MNIKFEFALSFCLGFLFLTVFSHPCKPNAQFQECGTGCPLTCQNHREIFCTEHCKSGCFCNPGYVLDPHGNCILPHQCPIESLCPANEHYTDCVVPCNDCWSRGHCEEQFCTPGCDCHPGYYRDYYGTCIPQHQCPSPGCKENEVYTDCVIPCNDCQTKGHCRYTCETGCDCRKGYYRNSAGVCVQEYECFARVCGHYEVYKECGPAYEDTCKTLGKTLPGNAPCKRGCFCMDGYLRGPDGQCIAPAQCPKICGPLEEYKACGPQYEAFCSNYTTPYHSHGYCKAGCFCITNYIRGPEGKCILPSQCPMACGHYEEYKECGLPCRATCAHPDAATHCGMEHCIRGCHCIDGYVIGPQGKCIPFSECPPECGYNEVYDVCGPECQTTCDPRADFRGCSRDCVKGCFCKPGTVRGPNGQCIPKEDCPIVCGANEVFEENRSPCEYTCTDHHRHLNCKEPGKRGCFCKPGFVRDDHQNCIDPASCPLACKENEINFESHSACESTCANRSLGNAPCPLPNKGGCFCAPGYVRNTDGRCIDPKNCPIVCGVNEVEKCGYPLCEHSCQDHHRHIPCDMTQRCKLGCYCREGFVRDSSGKCVNPALCHTTCKEYEEFNACGSACPRTCANKNPTCLPVCVRGCVCKRGYIKNASDICILEENCPIDCSKNEEFSLCGHCEPTCFTLQSPNEKHECKKGCFCKKGFIRGPKRQCMLQDECSKYCGKNEVFLPCGKPCQPTCSNHTRPSDCPDPCISGCFCKPRLVRNQWNKCISTSKCPRTNLAGRRGPGDDLDDDSATTLKMAPTTPAIKIPSTKSSSKDEPSTINQDLSPGSSTISTDQTDTNNTTSSEITTEKTSTVK